MSLLQLSDITQLSGRVLPFLADDEIRNNIPLGIIERLQQDRNSFTGYLIYIVEERGEPQLYAHHIPSFPLCLSEGDPKNLGPLIQHLQSQSRAWNELYGSVRMIEAFFQAWPELREEIVYQEGQGLFRLTRVIMPKPTGNTWGQARPEDVPNLASWLCDFCRETGEPPLDMVQSQNLQSNRQAAGDLHCLWNQGTLVSMAIAGRRLPRGRTVGYVYTPPQLRGRGYASDLVARLSQSILDSGYQYCALFTQLANPTSNKIYQDIGYQWVDEFRKIRFRVEEN